MAPTDPALGLRPVLATDADFFYQTRRACFRAVAEGVFGPWNEAAQRRAADRDVGELPIEIALHRGAPVGYLLVLHRPDHLWLDEIAVVPAAQRGGLGTALVHLAMDRARSAGLPLRLSVLINNPAQALYLRLGFAVTHTEHPRIKMAWTPERSSGSR